MKTKRNKINQEKNNAEVIKMRTNFTDYMKNKMINTIISNISKVSDDTPYYIKKDIYSLLLKEVLDNCAGLYKFDTEKITNHLNQVVEQTSIDVTKTLRTTQEDITQLKKQIVLNKKIKGLTCNNKIWNNITRLGLNIENIIYNYLFVYKQVLGTLSEDITKAYDMDLYNVTKLLNNETTRVEYETKKYIIENSNSVINVK